MKANNRPKKLSSFWIGPLVAGSCLAAGYELTQRFMIIKSTQQEPKIELFKDQRPFPGKSLQVLSRNHTFNRSSYSIDSTSKKTILSEKKKKRISNMAALKDKEMLNALEGLETNVEKNGSSKQNKLRRRLKTVKKQKATSSYLYPMLKPKKIDELWKTLHEP